MKKLIIAILFLLTMMPAMVSAQESNFRPIPSWPFLYQDFKGADVYTTNGKKVFAKSNIHVGMRYLWFINNAGTKLAAVEGTISKVAFRNGETFYAVEGKMCKVIKEDSINGKLYRLYELEEIDRPRFEEFARANSAALSNIADGPFAALNKLSISVAENEGSVDFAKTPLPMTNRYYMLYDNEVFEMKNSNILKHLSDKSERHAYNAYLRKAEIIFSNRRSMLDIYDTFFISKLK